MQIAIIQIITNATNFCNNILNQLHVIIPSKIQYLRLTKLLSLFSPYHHIENNPWKCPQWTISVHLR